LTGITDATIFLSIGFLGGFLGSILGIGGGSLMTPFLLAIGYDVTVAVPASLLAIVGTSMGGLYVYDEKELIDYELAVTAETVTIPGSITGVYIAVAGFRQLMRLTLATILILISIDMLLPYFRNRNNTEIIKDKNIIITRRREILGFASMYFAGMISGLAGVGGGVLKVPVLNKMLGVNIKKAVATSKLMVGLTGAAGAIGYYLSGLLHSCLALSLVTGSLLGGLAGSKAGVRLSGRTVTLLFAVFLAFMSIIVIIR